MFLQTLLVPDGPVLRVLLAPALGLLLGLEREWSGRPAGIRTFALIALLGSVFAVIGESLLLALGGALVAVLALTVVIAGFVDERRLSLTTAVSMLVTYGVGVLVGVGFILEGVTVAILSALLLVLRRELHSFAGGLTHEELRAAVEFGVIAFVVFPLLPAGAMTLTIAGLAVVIEPRIVWLLVVTVAGIAIVNYAIATTYGGRGVVVTGFFGGLASSTAVVGTTIDHVRQHPKAASYGVAAILLADAAMALRNLGIVVAFTVPEQGVSLLVVPLGIVIVGAIVIALSMVDWRRTMPIELDYPFSLRNVLGFGLLFAIVVAVSSLATSAFGDAGFLVASALSGLVSSAGATTAAVVLYRGGAISVEATGLAVVAASLSSMLVKVALASTSTSRQLRVRVTLWSGLLMIAAAGASFVLLVT